MKDAEKIAQDVLGLHEMSLARDAVRKAEDLADESGAAFDAFLDRCQDALIGRVGEPGFSAEPYLAQEAVSDTGSLEPVVDAILAANPAQVEQYRGGKQGLLGFFVGQVMKETKGTADARAVNELVRAKLDGS